MYSSAPVTAQITAAVRSDAIDKYLRYNQSPAAISRLLARIPRNADFLPLDVYPGNALFFVVS